ncbi:MAG: sugar phosphate isomerase/epimerase [Gammaproteobacteria bacterium]|nr:sugar phosphate isomerase/epimerase [Gammaproteobacteria bacterium]
MIYVSSSCVKHNKIKDSVLELVENGFQNIELSGGTEYYDTFEKDLLELKDKYNLNYICHNYFPPPKNHFVLNLASLENEVYEISFNHLVNAIELSKRLGAKKFAFHAGFFLNIQTNEIGKKISKHILFDKSMSIKKFQFAFKALEKVADTLELYIENNVFSDTNQKTFGEKKPFMLCDFEDYQQLHNEFKFNLLLDIAHLKVSSHSLNQDFDSELTNMIGTTDYIHISDNDSLHDINDTLIKDSDLVNRLKKYNLKNKYFTLEVYNDIDKLKNSFEILQEIIQ